MPSLPSNLVQKMVCIGVCFDRVFRNLDLEQALAMIQTGALRDARTMLLVQHLALKLHPPAFSRG